MSKVARIPLVSISIGMAVLSGFCFAKSSRSEYWRLKVLEGYPPFLCAKRHTMSAPEKSFHVSWDQLHRDARALAWRLDRQGPGDEGGWRAVLAITRGGMAPAVIVARELNIRVIDTISVKSYDHQTQGATHVLKGPDASILADGGAGVLVIDDLVDTGRTLEVVRRMIPKAHFATVYAKPKGRPLVDTFITEVSQDTWIFFPWDMALQYAKPLRGID